MASLEVLTSPVQTDSKNPHLKHKDKTQDIANVDLVVVDFGENDPENPMHWSFWRKWLIVFAVSLMGFVSVFATMTVVPAAPEALSDLHSNNSLYRTLIATIWELGEGVGPFFIAPLSEKYGRLLVFHFGNLLALCCMAASALSVNISMLIAFRFLSGCFLAILTLGPAIVGDMFRDEERGVAMTLTMGCQLVGEFVSPPAGSYIAESLGWRWSIWLAAIVLGTCSLILLSVLRETYAVTILERRTRLLNKSTNSQNHVSKYQVHIDSSAAIERFVKPIQILFRSPITMAISIYTAITYALCLLVFSTLTEVMESTYSFSNGAVGLTFLGLAVGSLLAMLFFGFTSDRHIKHVKQKQGDAFRPESRLVFLLLAAVLFPLGFLVYGWTSAFHVQYVVPLIGTSAVGFTMVISILSTETYLVEMWGFHSASAIASGVILRAILGAVLPLIGPPLYDKIGLGWGNSVFALIAAVFMPLIAALVKFGDWFRSKESLCTTESAGPGAV